MKKFNELFHEIKNQKGISNQEIADKLNIDVTKIGHYSSGSRTPKNDFIIKFCDAYKIDIDIFYNQKPTKEEFNSMLVPRRTVPHCYDDRVYNYIVLRLDSMKFGDVLTKFETIAKLNYNCLHGLLHNVLSMYVADYERSLGS